MYYTTTINGAKAHVFDTKDLNKCDVVLSASRKTATLQSMVYDYDKTKYREVARVNGAIFDMSNSTHQGWEYSDVYQTPCHKDTRADIIMFNDGTFLLGDIDSDDVDLSKIKWAYSGAEVIIKDGEDVSILASWRSQYAQGKYCWSWFGARDDGTYVIGAIDESATCKTSDIRMFLKSLNVTNAMVNDGGGSAELMVGKEIKNRSSQRAIANGLFILESLEGDSASERLIALENENNALKQENTALKTENNTLKKRLEDKDYYLNKALNM